MKPDIDQLLHFMNEPHVNRILGTKATTIYVQKERVSYSYVFVRLPAIKAIIESGIISPKDTVYEIGCGLGRVVMLFAMYTGATVKGVEYEERYCERLRKNIEELNLTNASVISADAREVDYTDGDVFFMYAPFGGILLQQIVEKLREVAKTKPMKLLWDGPFYEQLRAQTWLTRIHQIESFDVFERHPAFAKYHELGHEATRAASGVTTESRENEVEDAVGIRTKEPTADVSV